MAFSDLRSVEDAARGHGISVETVADIGVVTVDVPNMREMHSYESGPGEFFHLEILCKKVLDC